MAAFPLQKHIVNHSVSVQVQALRAFLILLHHNASLQHCRFLCHSLHIIQLIPPVHVLLHRLSVEKHHGRSRCHGLFDDHRGRCPVHRINTQHIAPQGNKALHLIILGILAPFGVLDVQIHLHALFLLIVLGTLLQLSPDIIDKGIVPPIQAYPDTD